MGTSRDDSDGTIAARRQVETEITASIGAAISVTHRAMRRRLSRTLSAHGLDYGSWFFLRVLLIREGYTQRELADLAGMTQGASAAALGKMRQKNLLEVRPDPRDRRASLIFLSEEARTRREEFVALSRSLHAQAVTGLSADQVELLQDMLLTIRRNCTPAD